jgi:anti-sigma28 factor (negative regulator of flagellin synthesis)
MKVNDPNLRGPSGLSSTGVSKPAQTGRSASGGGVAVLDGDESDGVQLSGLAQSLRVLETDSPERQAHIEGIARAYAQGNYPVDAAATASGIINDALKHR